MSHASGLFFQNINTIFKCDFCISGQFLHFSHDIVCFCFIFAIENSFKQLQPNQSATEWWFINECIRCVKESAEWMIQWLTHRERVSDLLKQISFHIFWFSKLICCVNAALDADFVPLLRCKLYCNILVDTDFIWLVYSVLLFQLNLIKCKNLTWCMYLIRLEKWPYKG